MPHHAGVDVWLRVLTPSHSRAPHIYLTQAALSAQALVPKGPTQAKLTSIFARKPAADGDAMDVDDD